MTDAERIAHLEAELAREREEKTRLLAIVEALTMPKPRSAGADRQARYRERHADTSRVTSPVTPGLPPPLLDGSPPPSAPSSPSPLSSPPPSSPSEAEGCEPMATVSQKTLRQEALVLDDEHPAKPQRKLSAAEQVYVKIQELREVACRGAVADFVPDRWPPAMINKQLGAVVKAGPEEQARFEGAFAEYLSDETRAAKGWPLTLFMHGPVRSMYEKRALDAQRGAA